MLNASKQLDANPNHLQLENELTVICMDATHKKIRCGDLVQNMSVMTAKTVIFEEKLKISLIKVVKKI